MPLYDRPVRSLVHDMVFDLAPNPGTEFTREEALAWFKQHYPKVNGNTASATLIMITTNLPSRLHYGPRSGGEDDLLFQLERGRYRRYDPATDAPPIRGAEPSAPCDLHALLLPIVESVYPAWTGFDDPRFLNEEIVYKQHAVNAASEMLNRTEMESLLKHGEFNEIIDRLKSVARRGVNLLWMNMPDSGDLRILNAPGLDRSTFCLALFELLHGEGESHERFARYLEYVAAADLPTNWAFPTYFLFVCHPESELLVKPEWMKAFLTLINRRKIMAARPNAGTYEALLRVAGEVRAAFDEFDPADMIDIQSLMWVCATKSDAAPRGGTDMDTKRIEVRALAEGRARTLIERHLGKFDEAKLREFLREANTDWQNGRVHYNRFGTTFGGSLVAMMVENIEALNVWTERVWKADETKIDGILDEFWEAVPVKGAGRGYATMLLYLKDPQRHAIWLPALDRGLAALSNYSPMQARTASEYRRFQAAVLEVRTDLGLAPQAVDHVLWRAARKDDNIKLPPLAEDDDGIARITSIFEKLIPDPAQRHFANTVLADAVILAGELSPHNWSLTYRKDQNLIRLNVGMIEAMVVAKGEVQIMLLASALNPDERSVTESLLRFSNGAYRSMPEEVASGYVTVEWAMEHYAQLREAHRAFIRKASAIRTGRSSWARNHVPAIIDYLRQDLKRSVPSPEYAFDNDEVVTEVHSNRLYPLPDIAETTGFPVERLERWVSAINRKKQAIIYGPPGTGKTYIAKRLAEHLIGGGDGISETVQFHPAYAYEDFMQGIRPQLTANGGLDYRMMRGRFLSFCDVAEERTGLCVMIIDEINRANLARVMGELMYLLEYRDEQIPLAGGDKFRIPDNVRIIGTMNTADRSIALVDHALRRRFAFLELHPEFDILLRYHEREKTDFPATRLVTELRRLNKAINDPHYAIGISYFLRPDLAAYIEDIWRMEIEPYLAEYFYDQRVKAKDFTWDTIDKLINA